MKSTLESLATCREASQTNLTLFLDGPRGETDRAEVAATRAIARSASGFADVRLIERADNIGLSASIISGVTQMLEDHEQVIVLEDDMVVSPDFLTYMNQGLDRYADDPRVVSIHGYVYPSDVPLPDFFFLRGADCWGWATWRRGWGEFRRDGQALLDELQEQDLTGIFDFGGAFPYTQMLRDQIAGRVDSWAIRWYASAFLAGKLTLYPGRSLVQNIGLDGSGTNSKSGRGLSTTAARISELPVIPVQETPANRRLVSDALRLQGAGRQSLWARLWTRVTK